MDLPMLLDGYPLHRVRELHVSGGSWSEHPAGSGNRVRRDTHDGAVPDEIFRVLPQVLARCPEARTVILERMDGTIGADSDCAVDAFRAEFLHLKEIVVDAST